MDNWELNIINRVDNGLLLGWSFYNPEDDFDFYEFSIYLLFVQFQLRWE